MGKATTEQEKFRQAKARLRRIQHFEQVTHNVSRTCRFFGISRGQFYTWLRRYRKHGLEGLKNLKSGSRKPHLATPPHIVALILRVRAERQYGPIRICFIFSASIRSTSRSRPSTRFSSDTACRAYR